MLSCQLLNVGNIFFQYLARETCIISLLLLFTSLPSFVKTTLFHKMNVKLKKETLKRRSYQHPDILWVSDPYFIIALSFFYILILPTYKLARELQ